MNKEKAEVVRGFKVFDENWSCRGFQYAVGQSYTHEGKIEPCYAGFHFCLEVADCFNYYSFNPANKIAEVIAHGEIVGDGNKVVTNILEIVREVSWEEMLKLANAGSHNVGFRNSGDRNSGHFNSGNRNSGKHNSGDFNSGDLNSGDLNSGDFNSGDFNSGFRNSGNRNSGNFNSGLRNSGNRNSGDFNSGHFNSGDRNSGNHNSGNHNSGDFNSGDLNSGDLNSGDFNSGDFNSGFRNSGNRNSGNFNSGLRNSGNRNSGDFNSGLRNSGFRNSGHFNSGDRNSGNHNSGNHNSGEWNLSDYSTGCFNTETRPLRFFDKETEITWDEWRWHRGRLVLNGFYYCPAEWVWADYMTDAEKAENRYWEVTNGYLKVNPQSYNEAFQEFWNNLKICEKADVLTIPNFDAVKFQQITGVDVYG